MLENNNIIPFIFTFLPALFYALIVYVFYPAKTIKWKITSMYFFMGVLSTLLVNTFNYIFPQWKYPTSDSLLIALFVQAFLQIAVVEEGSKFAMFKISESYRNKKYVDSPLAIMFYAIAVSCGFAVSENILYAQMFGNDVLWIRSFTSVLVHMSCGAMLGYFVALGRINGGIYLYTTIGIISAVAYHGFYDFRIFSGGGSMDGIYAIVGLGVAVTFVMMNNLFTQLKNSIQSNQKTS